MDFDYASKSIKIRYLLKIHFTHLQQYDKNHCVYLARIGRYSEKTAETRPRTRSIELFVFA